MNHLKNVIASYSKEELEKNYKQALKNKDFKEFVDKFNLKDEVKQKYTTSLEDSYSEYSNCMNCKGLVECKNSLIGCAYLPKVENGKLIFQYKACKYKNRDIKQNRFKENITLFEASKSMKDAKMKDIITKYGERLETIKWINNFITSYDKNRNLKGLYLHGNFGCGKSYLLAAMFNELAKKGYKSTIIFFPEFLRSLKASFGSNSSNNNEFENKMYTVIHTPLLLIDDIGAENVTTWGRDEILSTILQYRMDNSLPTFFTSNLNIEELESHLSSSTSKEDILKAKRIIERIKKLTDSIEMISENLRN